MNTLPPGYRFIDYDHALISALIALDHRAAQRFKDYGFPYLAEQPMDRELWRDNFGGKDIWVVACDDKPVGYAVGMDLGELYWLREVSVDPAHGQKGIGTVLVSKVIERAKWAFHSAIGLSTFRNIPFNAPFYVRLGFLIVPSGSRDGSQNSTAQQQFWDELDDETDPSSRVLMLKRL